MSGVYKPRPVSDEDLELMRRLDALHLEHPFAGARMLRDLLRLIAFAILRSGEAFRRDDASRALATAP